MCVMYIFSIWSLCHSTVYFLGFSVWDSFLPDYYLLRIKERIPEYVPFMLIYKHILSTCSVLHSMRDARSSEMIN